MRSVAMKALLGVALVAFGVFAVVTHLRYLGRVRAVGRRTSWIADQFAFLGLMMIVLGMLLVVKG
jgi:hypothetical protein